MGPIGEASHDRLDPIYGTLALLCGLAETTGPWMGISREGYMLPTTDKARKDLPIWSGCLMYFPDVWAEIARVSKIGNDQHNPGEPLHWARGKSMDQMNTATRHMLDYGSGVRLDSDGGHHLAKAIWRLCAELQLDIEKHAEAKPLPVPTPPSDPLVTEWLQDRKRRQQQEAEEARQRILMEQTDPQANACWNAQQSYRTHPWCGDVGPKGLGPGDTRYSCSRPPGHKGLHAASNTCGTKLGVWDKPRRASDDDSKGCGEPSGYPGGWFCERERGHAGDHMAWANYAKGTLYTPNGRWPQ